MNFYVPTIGDKIYLEENWHFQLYPERRNKGFGKRTGILKVTKVPRYEYIVRSIPSSRYRRDQRLILTEEQAANPWYTQEGRIIEKVPNSGTVSPALIEKWTSMYPTEVWLPRKTCLTIDRIYIRKGSGDYDSITFRIISCPDKKMNKARFWVKLRDANKISCSLYPVHDEDSRKRLDKHDRFSNLDLL